MLLDLTAGQGGGIGAMMYVDVESVGLDQDLTVLSMLAFGSKASSVADLVFSLSERGL